MVTPLRFRAVTSRPRGKWRSIFLTAGVTRSLLRISLSSIVEGDVFSFLSHQCQWSSSISTGRRDVPASLLRLDGNLNRDLVLLYTTSRLVA